MKSFNLELNSIMSVLDTIINQQKYIKNIKNSKIRLENYKIPLKNQIKTINFTKFLFFK